MQDIEQPEEEQIISRETFATSQGADPATGEVPCTGEVTNDAPRVERALDGQIVPATAHSAGAFIDLLEDGRFSHEVYAECKRLGETLTDIGNATGQKVKGKVVLTLDLAKDGEAFTIQGKVKVTTPDMPRPKSIMWNDDAGNFCRFPPNQTQMFGSRPVRNLS